MSKAMFSLSVDSEVKDIIDKESKKTLVKRSVIVNEILKNHYKDELKKQD